MLTKLELYANTVKSMKVSQIYYRIRKKFKIDCSIGCVVSSDVGHINPIATVVELDFDPIFLGRFSADEIIANKITFLHNSKDFFWDQKWHFDDQSTLWNFNLHYFEYLFPLLDAYRKTGDRKYLDKSTEIINYWIDRNPQKDGGEGWSPYTVDLRLTNWLSYYSYVNRVLEDTFKEKLIRSIHEQYKFLSRHLEKDILGNHYFEDLKALVLCALFFDDIPVLEVALREFRKECREEILTDGMHFELSPMYHKLILEGIIRVAVALRDRNRADMEVEQYLQPMLDAAWSLEEGLERLPLFNDSGNNVAKSLQSLVDAGEVYFNIQPVYKSKFDSSGYYIFKKNDWKLIVDAGQPGPSYIPGHAHCDAGSFELFKAGKPVIVNCGTYAYQCEERNFFRSTAAHNTVMINDTEQSQCWGAFRMARRCHTRVLNVTDQILEMEVVDQKGQKVRRLIELADEMLQVSDFAEGCELTSFLHMLEPMPISTDVEEQVAPQLYSVDYGEKRRIDGRMLIGKNHIKYSVLLEETDDA